MVVEYLFIFLLLPLPFDLSGLFFFWDGVMGCELYVEKNVKFKWEMGDL